MQLRQYGMEWSDFESKFNTGGTVVTIGKAAFLYEVETDEDSKSDVIENFKNHAYHSCRLSNNPELKRITYGLTSGNKRLIHF